MDNEIRIDQELFETILDQAEDTFSKIRVVIPDDFLSYSNIMKVICSLNMQSSPGFPFLRYYSSNSEVFGFDGISVDPGKTNAFIEGFECWLNNMIEYPFRVFIKDEPHKPSKIELGRWRLIFSSPLYYQVLEHLLFDPLDNLEGELLWNLPTKLKWHPFWGGAEMCQAHFSNPCSIDKKMWDWTFSEQFIRMDTELRKRLVHAPPEWSILVDKISSMCFDNPLLCFSSGHIFRQTIPGLMKSGLVRTLSSNSHAQYFIHLLCCNKCGHNHKVWIIGDDVLVEDPCQIYLDQLNNFSLVKEVLFSRIFAGFNLDTVIPEYWSKHVTRLLYADDSVIPEILDNYQRLYVHSEDKFNLFQDMLFHYDKTRIRSKQYLLRWSFHKEKNYNFIIIE